MDEVPLEAKLVAHMRYVDVVVPCFILPREDTSVKLIMEKPRTARGNYCAAFGSCSGRREASSSGLKFRINSYEETIKITVNSLRNLCYS